MRPSDDPNCTCDFTGAGIGWCRYCMEKVWKRHRREWERVKENDPELADEYARWARGERGEFTEEEAIANGRAIQEALSKNGGS